MTQKILVSFCYLHIYNKQFKNKKFMKILKVLFSFKNICDITHKKSQFILKLACFG